MGSGNSRNSDKEEGDTTSVENMEHHEVLQRLKEGLEIQIRTLTHDIEEVMPEGRSEQWEQKLRNKRNRLEKELQDIESKLDRLEVGKDRSER